MNFIQQIDIFAMTQKMEQNKYLYECRMNAI